MGGRRRLFLWALGAVAALVVVAWVALAAALPPAKVRALVTAQLERTLAREVRFTGASVGIWPPVRLTVWNLALAAPEGFAKGRVFEVRRLHLDLDLFALLGRKVVVRRLVLDEPSLDCILRPDGTTNLDGVMKPAPGDAPATGMDFEVRELHLQSGRLLFDDQRANRRIVMTLDSRLGLAQSASEFRLDGKTTVSGLGIGPAGATRDKGLRTGLAGVRWRTEHRGVWNGETRHLEVERLGLRFGRAVVAFRGALNTSGKEPRYKLAATAQSVDLGEILRVLATADAAPIKGLSGSGVFHCDVRIESPARAGGLPALLGSARVERAAVRYPGAPASVRDLTAHIRLAPDTLEVTRLDARVESRDGDPTPVRARFLVHRFADPLARFAVDGTVNLRAVSPLVAPPGGEVAGRADLDVRGGGRVRDPGSFGVEGTARLVGVSLRTPGAPQPIEEVNGDLHFSSTRAEVQMLTARAGLTRVSLDATVDRPLAAAANPGTGVEPAGITFNLRSPHFQVADFVAEKAERAPLPNVAGRGRVEIARLTRDALDVRDVVADVTVTPTAVSVPAFSFSGYGGRTAGSAVFDYSEPARPAFAVDARADSLDADAFLSAWTPLRGLVRGRLGTEVELSGSGATPRAVLPTLTAVGLASLAQGTLGPGPVFDAIARTTGIPALREPKLATGSFPFAIEDGRFRMSQVAWGGETGEWTLGGTLGFDGQLDLGVGIALPAETAARLGAAGQVASQALRDDKGNVFMDLRVSGTGRSPLVSWDAAAARARLESRARAALQETRAEAEEKALEALRSSLGSPADSADTLSLAGRGQALLDSLKQKAPGDILKGLLGGKPDTTRR